MNCQRIQDSFLDFEAGVLPAKDAAIIREHLKTCPACQREWSALTETVLKLEQLPVPEASPRLRTQFYAMLDTHLRESESSHPFAWSRSRLDRFFEAIWPRRPVWQVSTAAVLLAAGLMAGSQFWRAAEPTADPLADARLAATQKELADLRAKVDSMDALVTYSLANVPSAQNRLKHIVAVGANAATDDQALAQLLNTLAFDPSTNLRLTALEALYARADTRLVRQSVLAALSREASPLVQVAMIDFLTSVREPDAAATLQQLAHAPSADQAVRTAAQRALALL